MPEFYRRARGIMMMPTFFGPTNIPPLEANALGVLLACLTSTPCVNNWLMLPFPLIQPL